MPAPANRLKQALAKGEMQIGLWLGMGSTVAAEIAAGAGYDWCLIDGEHGPNTVTTIRDQLQAMAGRGVAAVVRVPVGEDWVLKQVLDVGAQSVLVPMVDDAAQAEAAARAVRYPPEGVRGMGAALARASDYNAIPDYVTTANGEICLMVQIESAKAVENVDAIAAVEGIDCLFVGPADLSADMGHPGNPGHPDVVAAIEHAIARTLAAGKAAGIITFDPAQFAYYAGLGVTFLGVGGDVTVLAKAVRSLAGEAREAVKG
ncbi:HpcH/HpaI aldolase family protein [Acidimangrovimonas pyrenivorans]|uniref:HpcH/HpaI aldolase/citrate lyase family protein n=1 Tax=Acidimangrovimonas pyrenivorans TaxID=2030798 RepID=A0ABV7AEH8_9RHOB